MNQPFWHNLPSGFHRRRCVVDEGSNLGFEIFVWRGENFQNGPALLLNGATHGDEYEGPTFLTELARDWRPYELTGTVVAVPVLNEPAFFAGRRETPLDEKNLARVFPGDASGTATEKIAFAFGHQFIAHASHYVDFHSAGATYEILPWAGYSMVEDASTLELQRRMSSCFPDVWHWGTPYMPGRTISFAVEQKVPAIYLEFLGAGSVAADDLHRMTVGFQNLLHVCDLIPGDAELHEPLGARETAVVGEGHLQVEHPSPCDGILMHIAELGERIQQGAPLATVQPLDGSAAQTVTADRDGRVVFRRRHRYLRQGETLGSMADV